jgi:hypothetical protein
VNQADPASSAIPAIPAINPNALRDSVTFVGAVAITVPTGVVVGDGAVGVAPAPPVDAIAVTELEGLGVGAAEVVEGDGDELWLRLADCDRDADAVEGFTDGVGFAVAGADDVRVGVGVDVRVGVGVGVGESPTAVAQPALGYPLMPQTNPFSNRSDTDAARITSEPWLWAGTTTQAVRGPEGTCSPGGAVDASP